MSNAIVIKLSHNDVRVLDDTVKHVLDHIESLTRVHGVNDVSLTVNPKVSSLQSRSIYIRNMNDKLLAVMQKIDVPHGVGLFITTED